MVSEYLIEIIRLGFELERYVLTDVRSEKEAMDSFNAAVARGAESARLICDGIVLREHGEQ